MIGTNTGHGHVWERPDGVKARCGGPGLCAECSRDAARLHAQPSPPRPVDEQTAAASLSRHDFLNISTNGRAVSVVMNALYEYDVRQSVKTMARSEYVVWRLVRAGLIPQNE